MALFLALAIGSVPSVAQADKIDDLSTQLRGSSSYKVRLSAALTLTTLGSERGIQPLMRALRDREKSVRGVAAAGLGKLVTSRTDADVLAVVLAALKRVMGEDKDKFVRRQAKKAYTSIRNLEAKPTASTKDIFVDVGVMGDKTGNNISMRELMRSTTKKTLTNKAPSIGHERKPSKAKLRRLAAFHVDGTLTELSVKKTDRGSEIGCKVSMLIATFPKKNMFGVLKGGAKVRTGGSDRAISFGKADCVRAVVTDLIARRVIPTIQSRAK